MEQIVVLFIIDNLAGVKKKLVAMVENVRPINSPRDIARLINLIRRMLLHTELGSLLPINSMLLIKKPEVNPFKQTDKQNSNIYFKLVMQIVLRYIGKITIKRRIVIPQKRLLIDLTWIRSANKLPARAVALNPKNTATLLNCTNGSRCLSSNLSSIEGYTKSVITKLSPAKIMRREPFLFHLNVD